MSKIIVTNASEAYDYRTTIPVLPVGVIRWNDRPVRLVRIDSAADAEYQRDRYLSGLNVAIFTEDIGEGDISTDPDFSEEAFEAWLLERREARGLDADYRG